MLAIAEMLIQFSIEGSFDGDFYRYAAQFDKLFSVLILLVPSKAGASLSFLLVNYPSFSVRGNDAW